MTNSGEHGKFNIFDLSAFSATCLPVGKAKLFDFQGSIRSSDRVVRSYDLDDKTILANFSSVVNIWPSRWLNLLIP